MYYTYSVTNCEQGKAIKMAVWALYFCDAAKEDLSNCVENAVSK